jgi:hypothetical protein
MRTPYPPPDLYDRFLSWIHPAQADPPKAGTHAESGSPPQAGKTIEPNLPAAGTPTHPTDSAAETDPPTRRRTGGNQPSTGNAEPPHQGHRHNGPSAATPEANRNSLDL